MWGHQVFKFGPDGKLLMRLGKAGVAGSGPDQTEHTGSTGGEGIAESGGVIYGFGDHRQKMPAQRRYVKR